MLSGFVRRRSVAITIGLAALFLMALPMQDARADNLNFGNASNFNIVFNSNSGNGISLLTLLSLSGGLTDTQIFASLNNPSLNTLGSSYFSAWQAILLGSDGSISLSEANLFADLFGGNDQQWENFFDSWWLRKHTSAPEPGSLGLLACGLPGLLFYGGRTKRRSLVSR